MTRDQIIALRIGDKVYNNKTNNVYEIRSQWSDAKGIVSDDEHLRTESLTGFQGSIRMGDFDQWDFLSDDMPDAVKMIIITDKVLKLEAFVYSRFK